MAIVVLLTFCIKGLGTSSVVLEEDDPDSLMVLSPRGDSYEIYIPYSVRPFILDIEPKKIQPAQALSRDSRWIKHWPEVRKAYMFFLAELLAFYPDADFYFLARDAEYFYDIAMVLKQDIPEIQNNFYLLPISSHIVQHATEKFKEYLQQEGLHVANKRKKTAVIVDTCCEGTVIKYIRSLFPKEHRSKVKGHLFMRNKAPDDLKGDAYPESKIMQNALNHIEERVLFIEGYPHYFGESAKRSYQFESNGKIEILMPRNRFQRRVAIELMADIRYHFAQKQVQEDFKDILKQMRIVFNYLASSREEISWKESRVALKTLKKSYSILPTPFLKDIKEVLVKNKDSFEVNSFKDKIHLIYRNYRKMKPFTLYDKCIKALTPPPDPPV